MNAQHCGGEPCIVTSIACVIPMATISSKWLQSRMVAHTSLPLIPVLCSFFCSLLLLTFSTSLKLFCRTVSAQLLGVLFMMHTTARADRKELLAKEALCRSRLERWHGNYCTGIVLFLWVAAILWRIQQPGNHYAHTSNSYSMVTRVINQPSTRGAMLYLACYNSNGLAHI